VGVCGVVGVPGEGLGGRAGAVALSDFGSDVFEQELPDGDVAVSEQIHANRAAKAVTEHERILDAELLDELGGVGGEVVQIVRGGAGTMTVASMVGSEDVAVWEEGFDEPGMVDSH
jgi:hypothetical protein